MTASNKQPPRAIPEQSGASKHAENSATSKPPAGKPATITFHKKLYSRRYTDLVPPHSEKQRVALRNSIEAAGKVLVPILVTEDDELLDGAHRLLDAAELGLPATAVPFTVVKGLSDDEKRDLALSLNIHRRQLTQQQIRDLIESDLRRDPAQSDNLIATRYGVSHVTVGTRRRELEESGQIDKVGLRRGRGGAMHNVPPKPQAKAAVQSHGAGTPAGGKPKPSHVPPLKPDHAEVGVENAANPADVASAGSPPASGPVAPAHQDRPNSTTATREGHARPEKAHHPERVRPARARA